MQYSPDWQVNTGDIHWDVQKVQNSTELPVFTSLSEGIKGRVEVLVGPDWLLGFSATTLGHITILGLIATLALLFTLVIRCARGPIQEIFANASNKSQDIKKTTI
jgi:hypothetical protein